MLEIGILASPFCFLNIEGGDMPYIIGKRNKGYKLSLRVKKARLLLFDMNAMCSARRKIWRCVSGFFNKMIGGQGEDENKPNISFDYITLLLFAGLAHEDEALTEQQVGAKSGFDNMSEFSGQNCAKPLTKAILGNNKIAEKTSNVPNR
ncbi:hypothetical protein P7H19_24695 [Paenibacillus larvae]|nr:hypothetical protein [Paenibacillus larvae]MDT2238834.1 hypothetical protein [Paenibacillus larvae]